MKYVIHFGRTCKTFTLDYLKQLVLKKCHGIK